MTTQWWEEGLLSCSKFSGGSTTNVWQYHLSLAPLCPLTIVPFLLIEVSSPGDGRRKGNFFSPRMGPGKPRWPKNIEGPGRGSDASMVWKAKAVRLRGWAVRLGASFSRMGTVFSSAVYLHSLKHSPILSKCILNEGINECMGYSSGIRAFPRRASRIHSRAKYHFRSGWTEFNSKLHRWQAVWP